MLSSSRKSSGSWNLTEMNPYPQHPHTIEQFCFTTSTVVQCIISAKNNSLQYNTNTAAWFLWCEWKGIWNMHLRAIHWSNWTRPDTTLLRKMESITHQKGSVDTTPRIMRCSTPDENTQVRHGCHRHKNRSFYVLERFYCVASLD